MYNCALFIVIINLLLLLPVLIMIILFYSRAKSDREQNIIYSMPRFLVFPIFFLSFFSSPRETFFQFAKGLLTNDSLRPLLSLMNPLDNEVHFVAWRGVGAAWHRSVHARFICPFIIFSSLSSFPLLPLSSEFDPPPNRSYNIANLQSFD